MQTLYVLTEDTAEKISICIYIIYTQDPKRVVQKVFENRSVWNGQLAINSYYSQMGYAMLIYLN